MSGSLNFTSVEAFQAYTQDYSEQLIAKMFYGNNISDFAVPHEGVKGKLTLTQMLLGTLGRRWTKEFAPRADTIEFKPRDLNVNAGTFEMLIYPQEFESSYLGQMKKSKFDDTDTIPFAEYMMEKVAQKAQQEIIDAFWRGAIPAVPASTDDLSLVIDGFLEHVKDAITATDLTPYTTPGGAWTLANIIPGFEAMFELIDTAFQNERIDVHVSPKIYRLYQKAYRETYKISTESVSEGVSKLDFVGAYLVSQPGMGTSNRVIMTPQQNMHFGYDSLDEADVFNFEKEDRKIKMWSDFKLGCQFGFLEDGVVAVNDLV